MTQNTLINGLPYSEQGDPLSTYGARKKTEWAAIDSRLPARFSSVAIRNSTYAAWTAQGGVLVDGMQCSVAGRPMVYEGGWRGIKSEAPVFGPATRQLPLTRNDGVEDSFYAGTVADPGYPYRLWVEATARTYAAGCECHVRVRAGNGVPDNQLGIVTNVANPGNNTTGIDLVTPRRATGTLTGPSRVIGYAVRAGTGGSWEITSASVYYQVEPA